MKAQDRNTEIKKRSPYIVSVNKDETDNFMKDVMEEASKISTKTKLTQKFFFMKNFFIAFVSVCLAIFLIYTSYYYINHAILHKVENCIEK